MYSEFRKVLESREFSEATGHMCAVLGKSANGEIVIKDLTEFSHMIISGPGGSGKSTFAHTMLLSLIKKYTSAELNIVLCDFKGVEFSLYDGIPHLLVPPINTSVKLPGVISWLNTELQRRTKLLRTEFCRDFLSYNAIAKNSGESIPRILVVVDDIAAAHLQKNELNILENIIIGGRTVGIHIIIITQAASANESSRLVKSGIYTRMVLGNCTKSESSLLLNGQQQSLTSSNEMILYRADIGTLERVFRFYISDDDLYDLIGAEIDHTSLSKGNANSPNEENNELISDDSFIVSDALKVIMETGIASVSMIQRNLKIGYVHASVLMDQLEMLGYVGPFEENKGREILITELQWQQLTGKPLDAKNKLSKDSDVAANISIPIQSDITQKTGKQSRLKSKKTWAIIAVIFAVLTYSLITIFMNSNVGSEISSLLKIIAFFACFFILFKFMYNFFKDIFSIKKDKWKVAVWLFTFAIVITAMGGIAEALEQLAATMYYQVIRAVVTMLFSIVISVVLCDNFYRRIQKKKF